MKVKNDPRSEFSNFKQLDHSSLSSMTAVEINELFHIYLHHFTPFGKI